MIGFCLQDPSFFNQCRRKIKVEWFTCKPATVTLYDQMCKFQDKHGVIPASLDELFSEVFFKEKSFLEREKYSTAAILCNEATKNHTFEIIKKNLTGFLRDRIFKETSIKGAQLYNKDGVESAYTFYQKKMQELKEATFFDEIKTVSFDGGIDWLKKNVDTDDNSISTGCHNLDRALGGGLFKGETSAFMAPTNQGKSRALMTVVRHAVIADKKVLYITHEDHPNRITKRIYGAMVGMSPKQIDAALKRSDYDPQNMFKEDGKTIIKIDLAQINQNEQYVINQIRDVTEEKLKPFLTYLPYNKTGQMYVEDLVDEIKKLQEDQINKTGSGFDIIVDDYPKKLKTRNRTKEGLLRSELADVYDIFNQLAAELNSHVMVAIQTNRTGAKMNKGTIESDRHLGTEEIDESYGIAQNMGAVISLNRSPEDKKSGILHYCVAKSRNEKNDVTVTTKTNYAAGLLHGDANAFSKFGTAMKYGLASFYQDDNRKVKTNEADEKLRLTEEADRSALGMFQQLSASSTALVSTEKATEILNIQESENKLLMDAREQAKKEGKL
jgi:KaiC/GvpD/RAD55 family RecA-like ATPase